MNAVVVYFSRTGNTKRLAEAIADTAKAPIFELSQAEPSKITAYDLLIFGTPVEGASPTKEAQTYLSSLPTVTAKKAILFCTYKIFGNERAMKAIEKELTTRGYETLLKVSKKGMKPSETADFSKLLSEVKIALDKFL
jgi:flavodoxin